MEIVPLAKWEHQRCLLFMLIARKNSIIPRIYVYRFEIYLLRRQSDVAPRIRNRYGSPETRRFSNRWASIS